MRRSALNGIFNEGVMGFFGLAALATALGPLVFDVSPAGQRVLFVVEWLLVALFAADVIRRGLTTRDRGRWVRSPWRFVDAVVVLGPVLALLPQVSDVASSAPTFRLLRLFRAVAFGTRAGATVVRNQTRPDPASRIAAPTVTVVRADGTAVPAGADWGSFLAWTREPAASWFHASNMDVDRFRELAHTVGLPDQDLERVLSDDGHARLREDTRYATLVLQVPSVAPHGFPEVNRERLLAVVTEKGVLTAMTGDLDLPAAVGSERPVLSSESFPGAIVCVVFGLVMQRNQSLALRFGEEARRLETLEGGAAFLRETFRLRREISAAVLDLWHVRSIVRALASGDAKLSGATLENEEFLDDLLAEAESLYRTLDQHKEDLKSLIELHIHVQSFEMNGFLRLLAVVSFLGLIPSVASGLLGMEVLGNPWPVTLGQVAFGVAMGMAAALYVFAVKGWLK